VKLQSFELLLTTSIKLMKIRATSFKFG